MGIARNEIQFAVGECSCISQVTVELAMNSNDANQYNFLFRFVITSRLHIIAKIMPNLHQIEYKDTTAQPLFVIALSVAKWISRD